MTDKQNHAAGQLPKGLRNRGKRAELRTQFTEPTVQQKAAAAGFVPLDPAPAGGMAATDSDNTGKMFHSSDFSLSEGRARMARARQRDGAAGAEDMAAAPFAASAALSGPADSEESVTAAAAALDLGAADSGAEINLKQYSASALRSNPIMENRIASRTQAPGQAEPSGQPLAAAVPPDGDDPDLIPIKTTLSDDEVPNQPGAILKHAREMLGLTQRDIALRLKLRVNSISDIEHDRLNQPTAAAFARGHIANYARLVNIDPKIVVALYDENVAALREQSAVNTQRQVRRTRSRPHLKRWVYSLLFIAIALGLGLNFIYSSDSAEDSAQITEPLVITDPDNGAQSGSLNAASATTQGQFAAGASGELQAVPVNESETAAEAAAPVAALSREELNAKRAREQAAALGSNELESSDLPAPAQVDTTAALITQPRPQQATAQQSAAAATAVAGNAAAALAAAPAAQPAAKQAAAPVAADQAVRPEIVDTRASGTEVSLTLQEPAPALSSTLRDISGQVQVKNRDGLASLNSVSVSVKAKVYLRVTDSRGKVLAAGNYEGGDSVRVTGIPPIRLEVTDSSRIAVSYMGGSLSMPGAKQVSFVLPQR